ncbi:DUF6908 domain-containing protein [Chitinophaga sp. 30R24]|uniref:DUF6908 domain-containing protein n=1 Tax=Chitinophaga sp. 30R24 TaxID=3248838 RepID=UPI003B911DAF
MEKLNATSTRIFIRLMEKMGDKEQIRIESGGFMPLSMEIINKDIATPVGESTLYSVCHYYELNSDLMRDPEMCFVVVDLRTEPKDYKHLYIFPQLYRQDDMGIYQECVNIENNKMVSFIPGWQHQHCQFANIWLNNIRRQGFLH